MCWTVLLWGSWRTLFYKTQCTFTQVASKKGSCRNIAGNFHDVWLVELKYYNVVMHWYVDCAVVIWNYQECCFLSVIHQSGLTRVFGYMAYREILNQVYGILMPKLGPFSFVAIKYTLPFQILVFCLNLRGKFGYNGFFILHIGIPLSPIADPDQCIFFWFNLTVTQLK